MLGRLARTSRFLAVTTFGHADDAQAAVEAVRAIHERVTGTLPDGTPYAATDPHLLGWVHVAEVDSFLRAHQVYGKRPLDAAERDLYVAQTAEVARRLGVTEPPTTEAELAEALEGYRVELLATDHAREAVRHVLLKPPIALPARPAYGVLVAAAIGLMPRWSRRPLRLPWLPVSERTVVRALGTAATGTLRWALGPGRGVGSRARRRPHRLMTSIADLPDRWPLPGHLDLRDELLAAWAEPGRRYHDRRHLAEVLDRLAELGCEEVTVLLAAWFHDAVHVGAADDEERSAAWAERALPADVGPEVARLVRHDRAPPTGRRRPARPAAQRRRPGDPGRTRPALRRLRPGRPGGVRRRARRRLRPRPGGGAARPARQGLPVPHRRPGPSGRTAPAATSPPSSPASRASCHRADRVLDAARWRLGTARRLGTREWRLGTHGGDSRSGLRRRRPAVTSRETSSRDDTGVAPAVSMSSYHSDGTS